ncbi:T9SS type A sorting domain-containing protein [bacterium]|nr:T9SS type A sorting domain-containing protein [bacterium]
MQVDTRGYIVRNDRFTLYLNLKDEGMCKMKSSRSLACTFLLLFSLSISFADIIEIPDDYDTIQEGIDAATPHDTILVAPGTYHETLLISADGITLASEAIYGDSTFAEQTILIGDDTDPLNGQAVTIIGTAPDTVHVIGFTITGGNTDEPAQGGGIYASSTMLHLKWNIFENNTAYRGAAVGAQSSNALVEGNIVRNNTATHARSGISIAGNHVIARYNLFESNTSDLGYGPLCIYDADNHVHNNIFRSNSTSTTASAMFVQYGNTIIEDNVFQANRAGDSGALQLWAVENAIVKNNAFINNTAVREGAAWGSCSGLFIYALNTGEVAYNRFERNTSDTHGAALLARGNTLFHHNVFQDNAGAYTGIVYCDPFGDMEFEAIGYRNLFIGNGHYHASPFDYVCAVKTAWPMTLFLEENDFSGNRSLTVGGTGSLTTIRNNYWGHPSGPYHQFQNSTGLGDTLAGSIDITGFATKHNWGPNLHLRTQVLAFDTVLVNDTCELDATILNYGVQDLIVSIQEPGPDDPFTVSETGPLVLHESDEHSITVTFHPTEAGEFVSEFSLVSNDTLAPEQTVELRGVALDGSNTVSPTRPLVFQVHPVYPNPANNAMHVQIDLDRTADLRISLTNLLGQEAAVIERAGQRAGAHSFKLPTDDLASGVYLLSVRKNGVPVSTQKAVLLK